MLSRKKARKCWRAVEWEQMKRVGFEVDEVSRKVLGLCLSTQLKQKPTVQALSMVGHCYWSDGTFLMVALCCGLPRCE